MSWKITTRDILQMVFKVRPDESATVWVMFLYFFLSVGGTYVLGRAVSRGLFLSTLSKEDIPYRFIGMAIGVVLGASLYARVASHYRRDQLVIGTTSLMISGILIFRFLLDTPYADNLWVVGGLFVYFETVAALVNIQFWTFATEIFNPREAKRLFGLIAAGGPLATVIAGGLLSVAATYIIPKNLIFIVVLCLIGCIVCARALGRWHKDSLMLSLAKPKKTRQQRPSLLEHAREMSRSPLLITLSTVLILMTFVINVVDYQFDLSLQAIYAGDGQGLSTFLGAFFFWSGVVACAVQFLLTGRIMERFGIMIALLLLPGSIMLGSSFVLITGAALWAVSATRGADVAFRYTINDSAFNTLYLPVPADLRPRAKAIVDGILKPTTIGVAGLIFLALRNVESLTVVPWSILVMFLITIWIFLVIRVRRQHTTALAESLKKRRLNLDTNPFDFCDETTIQILVNALKHQDELRVLHVLDLITDAPQVDWNPHVVALLEHPSVEVKIAAARYLEKNGDSAYAEAMTNLFQDSEPEVHAVAIEAFSALVGQESVMQVLPFLHHADPKIKGAAITGLIKHGGLDGVLHAAEQLKQMLDSNQPEIRVEAARILGALQAQKFYHPLIELFSDENLEVQIAAIRAAGQVRAPDLLPHLVGKLGSKVTRGAAMDALVLYGPEIVPDLGHVLANGCSVDIRAQIPKVLHRLKTRSAAEVLLTHLQEPNVRVRASIYKALARLKVAEIDFSIDEKSLKIVLANELRYYYNFYVLSADLGSDALDTLLADALTVRKNHTLNRIFFLLGLSHPGQTLRLVRLALDSDIGRTRATAIELLDSMTEQQEVKELLLPAIEAPLEKVLEIAQKRLDMTRQPVTERLRQLATGTDSWLSASALYHIGVFGISALEDVVDNASTANDPLVRETAIVAARSLFTPERFQEILTVQTSDSQFLQTSRYVQDLLKMRRT